MKPEFVTVSMALPRLTTPSMSPEFVMLWIPLPRTMLSKISPEFVRMSPAPTPKSVMAGPVSLDVIVPVLTMLFWPVLSSAMP